MTENLQLHEAPTRRGLYEPRVSERLDEVIARLEAEPTRPLTEAEQAEARVWNDALAAGECQINDTLIKVTGHPEHMSLNEGIDKSSYLGSVHEINLDYFRLHFTGKPARGMLVEAGIVKQDQVMDRATLREAFLARTIHADTELIKEIALKSKRHEDARMANELVAGKIPEPPERLRVFTDGTNLMKRLQLLKQYKQFYAEVMAGLNESGDTGNLHDAKQAYVELYYKTINAKLAETYPDVLAFWYQAKHMSEPNRTLFTKSIETAFPTVRHLRADFLHSRARRLFIRLDHLRNGASHEHKGPYVSVSTELEDYINQTPAEYDLEPELSDEEIALFDKAKFNAEEMKACAEYVLAELGLLSSSQEPAPRDRPHRASDGKFQVVIRDEITSMGAEDPPGVFEIPADFNRTLSKIAAPVGVIPGFLHELRHIIQHENRRAVATNGIGASIKTKNQTIGAEAGGIEIEQRVQEQLFGRVRTGGPHYARAMLVLQAGGTEGEAIKAFYESYRTENPQESAEACAKIAVSRVMRLVRRKGGYDSQPLHYAESTLLIDKAKHANPHIKALLFDYGAFPPADLATLHQFDLLPKHVQHFPYDKALAATLQFVRRHLRDRGDLPS